MNFKPYGEKEKFDCKKRYCNYIASPRGTLQGVMPVLKQEVCDFIPEEYRYLVRYVKVPNSNTFGWIYNPKEIL